MSSTTLSELPAEIIEAILSEISHPYDLVQLACASSLFRNLVIPRHTEYRILWLRATSSSQFDFLWTHLLQRPNLTRNIWKVDMTEELTTNRLTPAPSKKVPLYPKTLIVDEKLDNSQNGSCRNTEALMLSALRLMVNLNSFTWRWATCPPSPDFLQFMFDIPSVQHVRLFSPYSIHTITEEISVNPPNDSPVLSLRIEGKQWTSSLLFNPVLSWFRTMTSLQTLKICSRLLHQCDGVHFPVLRDLVLFMPFDQDPTRTISFLARHNTIEALKFPSSCKNISTVPSGILPNLKKLRCHFSLLQAMSKADIEV
ncbi:hypothetical protein BDN72DRAFT_383534 [Pluteus cervinus]|uniref:Uncharacterized protein n=1 Tax=Pluteus cervinus TaxID=181527 RepID=A0ACD3A9Q6_9AGAR|nr:hypothetical protein BDN72DRAFT_383534 [Pluteus cervinus]